MEIDIYGKVGGYAEGVLATHVFTGNSMRLSESLRDQVGLKLALEFLDEQNVPADHPLRYLGRGWDWLPKCDSCDLGKDLRGNCCKGG